MTTTAHSIYDFTVALPSAFLGVLVWGYHHPGAVVLVVVAGVFTGLFGFVSTRRPGRK